LQINKNSLKFLQMVSGFTESKNKVTKSAQQVLTSGFLSSSKFDSFRNDALMRQMPVEAVGNGGSRLTLEDVFRAARAVKPWFTAMMTEIVEEAGLKPDEEVLYKGHRLLLDDDMYFTRLTMASLKSEERAKEKVNFEYDNDFSRLVDLVRCSVVLDTEEQFLAVVERLQRDDVSQRYQVVRLKNRFKSPLFNGYKDVLYSIRVRIGETNTWHVCEVQLHLAALLKHKKASHIYYCYFRTYFAGNVDAVEKQMALLEHIAGTSESEEHSPAAAPLARGRSDSDIYNENPSGIEQQNRVQKRLEAIIAHGDKEQLESTANLMHIMGDPILEARVLQRLVEIVRRGDDKEGYLEKWEEMRRLAWTKQQVGEYDLAEQLYHEILTEAEDHGIQMGYEGSELPLIVKGNLAVLLHATGRTLEAEEINLQALGDKIRLHGQEHRSTLATKSNLAALYMDTGRPEEAESYYREVLAGKVALFGESSEKVLKTKGELAKLLFESADDIYGSISEDLTTKRLVEAEEMLKEVVEKTTELFGANHRRTLDVKDELGSMLKKQCRWEDAEVCIREVLVSQITLFGPMNVNTVHTKGNLAGVLKRTGRLAEAEVMYREVVSEKIQLFGEVHRNTLLSMGGLAGLLMSEGDDKWAEGEALTREVLAGQEVLYGKLHKDTINTREHLVKILVKLGKHAEALLVKKEVMEAKQKRIHSTQCSFLNKHGSLFEMARAQPMQHGERGSSGRNKHDVLTAVPNTGLTRTKDLTFAFHGDELGGGAYHGSLMDVRRPTRDTVSEEVARRTAEMHGSQIQRAQSNSVHVPKRKRVQRRRKSQSVSTDGLDFDLTVYDDQVDTEYVDEGSSSSSSEDEGEESGGAGTLEVRADETLELRADGGRTSGPSMLPKVIGSGFRAFGANRDMHERGSGYESRVHKDLMSARKIAVMKSHLEASQRMSVADQRLSRATSEARMQPRARPGVRSVAERQRPLESSVPEEAPPRDENDERHSEAPRSKRKSAFL